jgi:hypothetical protein
LQVADFPVAVKGFTGSHFQGRFGKMFTGSLNFRFSVLPVTVKLKYFRTPYHALAAIGE